MNAERMLSSTVIGVELHRLGLKFNFGQVEVGLGRGGLELKLHEEENKYIEAKLKFNEAKPS